MHTRTTAYKLSVRAKHLNRMMRATFRGRAPTSRSRTPSLRVLYDQPCHGGGVIGRRPCRFQSVTPRQSHPPWSQPALPLSLSTAAGSGGKFGGSTSGEVKEKLKVLGERDGMTEVEIPASWSLFGAVGQGVTLAMPAIPYPALALVDFFMTGMHKIIDAEHPDTLGKAVVTALRSGRYDVELQAAVAVEADADVHWTLYILLDLSNIIYTDLFIANLN